MFQYLKNKIAATKLYTNKNENSQVDEEEKSPLSTNILDNIVGLRSKYQNSADFLVRDITISNIKVNFIMIEGMVNLQTMSEMLLEPLLNQKFSDEADGKEIYEFIHNRTIMAADMVDVFSYEEVFRFIMSGFVVILFDGLDKGIAFGMQGFNFRSISEPVSEVNERGSREGFTEPLRINMSMVRRRIKSPTLKFELMTVGKTSKTDICLMYVTDKVSPHLLQGIRQKIKSIKLDVILTSGYLQPFLEGKPWSLFSDVGISERPDVVAAKIFEGRVAILVDGTPYALIVPYLFSENFQSLDDYAHKVYFASFIRIIKYFSFFITILLPGLYVGVATFHPELLPHALLFNIAAAEEITPFPLFFEALIIHFLYEIMREAGLRLPRPIGHAVSIAGAIVIGDAAVTAGLIGAPMVFIIGLTAISAFVIPSLYEPIAILRIGFIILGGMMGLYGIALGFIVVLVNICSLRNFGIPYTSPIAPLSKDGIKDTFLRKSFQSMQEEDFKIQNLSGAHINDGKEEPR
ncbi:spore germination protein [Paludicola sp. MB14-C6]|uniref:spore germination protein n=1 Tax=Paludihabitans sp. MB14-C6 TaxID=3070656 RepID=UPI0027DB6C57|nr:spore germination protein [Paludicola sp. MB14-C6]WMJ23491.1 spore germination protein [Paludicola sp. MB14-C6]